MKNNILNLTKEQELEMEEALKESRRMTDEIQNMESRELLYRYGNCKGFREVLVYQGRFKDLERLEKEAWFYETELLHRLHLRGNDFPTPLITKKMFHCL